MLVAQGSMPCFGLQFSHVMKYIHGHQAWTTNGALKVFLSIQSLWKGLRFSAPSRVRETSRFAAAGEASGPCKKDVWT